MSRLGRAALAATVAVAAPGCAVRLGSSPDTDPPPSACARVGSETKLPFGAGAQAFAILWDTDHYVVAYVDPSTGDGDIDVARMDASGALIGAPAAVESTPAASDLPSLVKTPGGYLVAWQEGTSGTSVYVHALGPDAAPVGSGAIVAATQSAQARPVLAAAPGGQVAVAFMDSVEGKDGVQIALVDPTSLAVTGPERVAPDDADGWPWIAGDGSTLGMVWSDAPNGTYDVRFALVDPQPLSVGAGASLRGASTASGLLPRMIAASFGFLAAWEEQGADGGDNQIGMALVDPTGKTFAGGLVEEPGTGDADWPNMAWTGSAAGIVYYQFRTGRPQIYMSFVDATGARVGGESDLQVSNGSAGWSRYPDVAWTGSELGVVYVDTRDGPPALWFQRVSCHS